MCLTSCFSRLASRVDGCRRRALAVACTALARLSATWRIHGSRSRRLDRRRRSAPAGRRGRGGASPPSAPAVPTCAACRASVSSSTSFCSFGSLVQSTACRPRSSSATGGPGGRRVDDLPGRADQDHRPDLEPLAGAARLEQHRAAGVLDQVGLRAGLRRPAGTAARRSPGAASCAFSLSLVSLAMVASNFALTPLRAPRIVLGHVGRQAQRLRCRRR